LKQSLGELWFAGPWLLLLIPLVLRALPWGRPGAPRALSWRLDLPLGLGAGLGVALLSTALLSVHLTEYYPLSAADFDHYCELVARVAAGEALPSPGVRLPPPAWLPAALSGTLGLIDGLALQSFLALVATCGGLYLWGLAVHGRTAGLCAALLVGTVGPVGFLARDISFYPVVVGSSVLLAAAVAASLRFRALWPPLLAGLAAAVTLLADVRGVLFAAPLVGLGLAAALARGRGWRGRSLRVVLLLVPVVASWFVAAAVVPEQTIGLERQAVLYADQAVRDAGGSPHILARQQAETQRHPGFVWGVSAPADLPGTFLFSSRLLQGIPAEVRDSPQNVQHRQRHLMPWALPALLAFAVALSGLARRPWRLAALVLSAAPFASMLWATGQVLPQERHLATGLAVLPLLLGVGVAVLAEGPPRRPSGDGGWPPWPWKRALLLVALLVAMLGAPPSWLDHQAGWRRGIVQSEPRTMLQRVHEGGAGAERCSQALGEHRDEPWWPSRLYPRARMVIDGTDPWAPD
jgi:hypothetical protein